MKDDYGRRYSDVSFKIDAKLNVLEANRGFMRLFNVTDYKVNLKDYLSTTDAEHLQFFLSSFGTCCSNNSCSVHLNVGKESTNCLLSFSRDGDAFNTTIANLDKKQKTLEATIMENREFRTLLNKINSYYFTWDGKLFRLKNTCDFTNQFEGKKTDFVPYIKNLLKLKDEKECNCQLENLFSDIMKGDVEKTYKLHPETGSLISVNTTKFSTREGSVCIALISTGSKIVISENSYSEKHDGLTNLYNKLTITEMIRNKIDVAKNPCTLLIIDVDNFKECNDNYGHAFGDTVLVTFANILQESIGTRGVAGRIGGDEFMALVDCTEESDIRNIARSIKLGIQWGIQAVKPESVVTCSIGAVRIPSSAATFDEAFKLADKCLYIAKSRGRNCYIIYKPNLHDKLIKKMTQSLTKNQTGQAITSEALSELAIIQMIQGHTPNYIRIVFEMLLEYMQVHRITLFKKNEEKKWERVFISGNDVISEPRLKYLKRGYFKYFNSYDFLHMDNINAFDTLDKTRFHMYLSDTIASTLEILIRDSEGMEKALICFDVFKPARTFRKSKVVFALMISKLLANEL